MQALAQRHRASPAKIVAVPRSRPPVGRRAPGLFAPEVDFLAAQGVAPGLLARASRVAAETGVSADQALLAEGFSEQRFYTCLARHIGAPFLNAPLPLRPRGAGNAEAVQSDVAPLDANARKLALVLAPRGHAIRHLLRAVRPGAAPRKNFAIATPRRLAALVRRRDRAALLHAASGALADWDGTLSARDGVTDRQVVAALGVACALVVGALCAPHATFAVCGLAFCLLFLTAIVFRLSATAVSSSRPGRGAAPLSDHRLPLYTVVVPLYREARVVPHLVAAIERLDYPRAKLDIKLMLEAGDAETLAAVEREDLPARYEVIVVPPGAPRTKPRALNVALASARGALLAVFDAEDRPEPSQLRDAAALFAARPACVACVQAELAIDHAGENWLTRLFAMEYAGLFGAVKPGLAALGLPIPLGGTSNHFRIEALRRVGGWDAWNVTEDIDLGFRLARFGFRIESLPSVTFEEAPVKLGAWLLQRRRWLKGWFVTLFVHMRQPVRLFRELGLAGFAWVAAALLGTLASCLLGPFFVALVIGQAWAGTMWHPATAIDALWSATGCFLLLSGTVSAVWPIAVGLGRRRRRDLLVWLPTLPIYLLLVSVAAWLAALEGIRDPQRWNKTEHGLARTRR